MRKVDYSLLAQKLNDQRGFIARKIDENKAHPFNLGQAHSIELVARWCADNLSVNKAEFLKACGID